MLRYLTTTDHNSIVGRIIRFPLRLIPPTTIVRIPSGLNKGFRWICGSSIQRCWFGTYEFDKQDFVARIIKPGMTVWDVGANVGFYTLAFAGLVGKAGKVISYEPLAANVRYLLRHIELNHLRNITVIQAALSDTTELLGFTATSTSSIGTLTSRNHHYLIPTLTPTAIVEAFPAFVPQIIKLDIEGAEATVLTAARSLLQEHSPDILLALHGKTQEERCVELLNELGYNLFYLNGRQVDINHPLSSDEVYASRRGGLT